MPLIEYNSKAALPITVRDISLEKHWNVPYGLREAAKNSYRDYPKWSNKTTTWHFPMFPQVITELFKLFEPNLNGNKYALRYLNKAEEVLQEFTEIQEVSQKLQLLTVDNIDAAIAGGIVDYPINIETNYYSTIGKKSAFTDVVPIIQKPDYHHQKIGYIWGINLPAIALFWEMGCGKTKTAIQVANYKLKKGIIDTVIVFAPLSILRNWEREFVKWSDLRPTILTGHSKDRQAQLEYTSIAITNFESLLRVDFHDWITESTMIIIDESSLIKNPYAKRTKKLLTLSRQTKHKIIMSGTPITQGAFDIFTQFKFVDPSVFGYSYKAFKEKYFYNYGFKLVPMHGETTLNEIRSKIKVKATRFLKAECLDLPPKIFEIREIEFAAEQSKIYDQMVSNFFAWLDTQYRVTAPIVLVQLLRLSQITSGFIKTPEGEEITIQGENPKLKELSNVLDEISGKIVIWARFKHDIKLIGNLCKEKGLRYGLFYGETKIDERNIIEEKYQQGKLDVFIGTPDTGGKGLNLVPTDYVIFYSKDYSLDHRLQAEDRSHRPGMADKITYIDILIKKSIDTGIHVILKGKKNVADIVTGDRDKLRGLLGGI